MYSASSRALRRSRIMVKAMRSSRNVSKFARYAWSKQRSMFRYSSASSSSVMPAANSPCFVALNRVDVVLFGPVDFFALRRFAEILLVMIPLAAVPPGFPIGLFGLQDVEHGQ